VKAPLTGQILMVYISVKYVTQWLLKKTRIIGLVKDTYKGARLMQPQEIAQLISEEIAHGSLGLTEEKEAAKEPGDLREVLRMVSFINNNLKDLAGAAKMGGPDGVKNARKILTDMNGALKLAFVHVNRLANELGLPEPEYRSDT
jgi:hypothetical protein